MNDKHAIYLHITPKSVMSNDHSNIMEFGTIPPGYKTSILSFDIAEHRKQMLVTPRPILKARLYIVLLLLAALFLFGASFSHGNVGILPLYIQYSILVVVTLVFLYSSFPFVNRVAKEVNKGKISVAIMVLLVMTFAYLHSISEFFEAKTISSLTEFSSLLLIFVSGGYFLEIKGHENSVLLNSQQAQIDNILASLDEVIWSVNSTTLEMVYTNAACLQVWGYSPSEMIEDRTTFLKAIHPDDKGMFYEAIHNVIVSGIGSCEYRIFHKDKSVKYLRSEARLQKSIDGKADLISGITIDITKQRLAEMDANRTAKEIENILSSINDAFFAISNKYVITYVNKEFRALYKNKTNIFIGVPYKDIAPEELQKEFYKNCRKAMNENTNTSFEEYSIVLKKWFYYKIYPATAGATIYITDITEQKELLQSVIDEKAKLQAQNLKLSEIAWIQSHKVRSPLANILGLIPLLDFSTPENPENAAVLTGIKTASERLDAVVHEITDKTRSNAVEEIYPQLYGRDI